MNDDSLNLLKRAVQCRDTGNYGKAQEYLDNLIEADPENHLLWYEKSKLPIVQEDNVIVSCRCLFTNGFPCPIRTVIYSNAGLK